MSKNGRYRQVRTAVQRECNKAWHGKGGKGVAGERGMCVWCGVRGGKCAVCASQV